MTFNQHFVGVNLVVGENCVTSVDKKKLIRFKTNIRTLPIKTDIRTLPTRSTNFCPIEPELSIYVFNIVNLSGETYNAIFLRIAGMLRHYFGYSPRVEKINHQILHLVFIFYHMCYQITMCLSIYDTK